MYITNIELDFNGLVTSIELNGSTRADVKIYNVTRGKMRIPIFNPQPTYKQAIQLFKAVSEIEKLVKKLNEKMR